MTKISERLINLDSNDIQVPHIPKLLEAVVRIRESLLPGPTQTPQPLRLMGATELRLELKQLGLLTDPPQTAETIRRDLQAWIDGTPDPI